MLKGWGFSARGQGAGPQAGVKGEAFVRCLGCFSPQCTPWVHYLGLLYQSTYFWVKLEVLLYTHFQGMHGAMTWHTEVYPAWCLTLYFSSFQTFYRQCVQEYNQNLPKTIATPTTDSPHLSANGTVPPAAAIIHANTTSVPASTTTTTTTVHNTLSRVTRDDSLPELLLTGTAETVCEQPWSYVPENILPDIWQIIYWTTFVLTWYGDDILWHYLYMVFSCFAVYVLANNTRATIRNDINMVQPMYYSPVLVYGVV